ncbi:YgfZ/GcvT domain-containing protein [Pseudactinotalea sp. Z1748]|uniref:CAF17-like 4Fe-4S cluster assembly/insertion protein YgfZ n=1 Tax=Pseudactinotalea sp. Z1748 TaxID=3413027 RepID=UPI003C7B2972
MSASALMSRQGAVAAADPDEGVAAHYGEPMHEQRALEQGRAVVDLSHRGVVTVTGADRLTWLHSITSQHLNALEPGVSTEMLVLDPHGRVEHAAAVIDDGATTWLITESGTAAGLVAYLESMKFAMRVEVGTRTDLAVLGTSAHGPTIDGALIQWRDPWPVTAPGSTRYGPDDHEHPGAQWQGTLWLVQREDLPAAASAAEGAGARLAGVWAWEALRVATWRPRHARECDERTIPHELDWLRTAVHLEKGCYRGQETIARVFTMGRPPRRLTMLHLDGSEHITPDPGATIMHGEREVGRVTSVVRHHELGPVALAVLKRSVDPEATLSVEGLAAGQETIVTPEGFGTGRPPPQDRPRPNPALRRRP